MPLKYLKNSKNSGTNMLMMMMLLKSYRKHFYARNAFCKMFLLVFSRRKSFHTIKARQIHISRRALAFVSPCIVLYRFVRCVYLIFTTLRQLIEQSQPQAQPHWENFITTQEIKPQICTCFKPNFVPAKKRRWRIKEHKLEPLAKLRTRQKS